MRGLDQFFWINGKFWFGCQNWHSPGLLNTTKWRNSITFQDKYLFSIFQLLPSKSISSTVESYWTECRTHRVTLNYLVNAVCRNIASLVGGWWLDRVILHTVLVILFLTTKIVRLWILQFSKTKGKTSTWQRRQTLILEFLLFFGPCLQALDYGTLIMRHLRALSPLSSWVFVGRSKDYYWQHHFDGC